MGEFFSSYALGLVFIVLVSLIWAAASVLVQYLYSDNFSFDSPFLLTYIGVSLFTTLLPLQYFLGNLGAPWENNNNDEISAITIQPPETAANSLTETGINAENNRGTSNAEYTNFQTPPTSYHGQADAESGLPPVPIFQEERNWSMQNHIWTAAKIAPVWFISNYAYNSSLKYTSITSSTVLASTGSIFTFLFAVLWKDEHFNWFKFTGILLGMMGSILTGLHDIQNDGSADSDHSKDVVDGTLRLWGDVLGLVSAVGYGAYATMIRVLCPRDESKMSMQLFLGFVGLWNMVLLSPIAVYQGLFNAAGLTWLVFGFLVLKGLLDNVLSDYLWARAVVLTSATVATVGLGLTIPLAFASDFIMGRPDVLDTASISGAFGVLIGFVLVNMGQKKDDAESNLGALSAADSGELQELQPYETAPSPISSGDSIALSTPENQDQTRPLSLEYKDEVPTLD